MKVKVVHLDLNPCGGAEHLAIVTLKALVGMGAKVDLALAKEPDIERIAKSSSENVRKIFDSIQTTQLGELPLERDSRSGRIVVRQTTAIDYRDYDVIINTHADILPILSPLLNYYITYCHFPAAATHIRSHDKTYLNFLLDMGVLNKELAASEDIWDALLQYYLQMLKGSLVVTNSKFSQRAIISELRSYFGGYQKTPSIISPPVSVSEMSRMMQFQVPREDKVLIISRIHPSKQIENAIELARILVRRKIGRGMMIVGNITSDYICQKYYKHLISMTERYGLSDYVSFLPSTHIRELRNLLQKAKAYFHPMQGEPFGISVVEAMAAGVVPVVPDVGGMTEFVPKEYQFKSIEEAADKIQAALQAPYRERERINELAKFFSAEKYEKQFTRFIDQNVLSSQRTNPTLRLARRCNG